MRGHELTLLSNRCERVSATTHKIVLARQLRIVIVTLRIDQPGILEHVLTVEIRRVSCNGCMGSMHVRLMVSLSALLLLLLLLLTLLLLQLNLLQLELLLPKKELLPSEAGLLCRQIILLRSPEIKTNRSAQ